MSNTGCIYLRKMDFEALRIELREVGWEKLANNIEQQWEIFWTVLYSVQKKDTMLKLKKTAEHSKDLMVE